MYSLDLASGVAVTTSTLSLVPRLHAGGRYMYVGGYACTKWDISQGVLKSAASNVFAIGCGGNLWLSEDGRRAFNACAKVYTTSDIPAQDGQYNATLSSAGGLVWADESAQRQTTAVIPLSGTGAADDTQVQFYGDASLAFIRSSALPRFSINGTSFAAHGRFVFWNQAATAVYAVVQADPSAHLLAGSGVSLVQATASNQFALTLATAPVNAGNVSPASGISYPAGSLVPVSVTPSAPNSISLGPRTFQFSSWTGPVANPALASTSVTMTGPVTITANLIPTSSFFVT